MFSFFYIFSMNKPMFWIGVIIAAISAVLFAGNFVDDTSPIVLLIIGIGLIGASNYRLLKKKEK